MVEEFNSKLGRAIKKLLTIDGITLVSIRSSNYTYGIKKPYFEDRYNLEIKLDSDLILKTQVIFDVKSMSFPPDIIIHKLPTEHDISKLLPKSDWDIDREDCLYNWFKRILNILKKPEPIKQWSLFDKEINISQQEPKQNQSSKRRYEELSYKTNMDDDYEDNLDFQFNDHAVISTPKYDRNRYKKNKEMDFIEDESFFADQDELLAYKTREETSKKSSITKRPQSKFFTPRSFTPTDRVHDSTRNKTYIDDDEDEDPILLVSSVKAKKTNLGRREVVQQKRFDLTDHTVKKKLEFRKKFMKAWLNKYKREIIKYDTNNYSEFTLLIDFRLPSKSYQADIFKEQKKESIRQFVEEHSYFNQISKPKSIAPIIVHFKMNQYSFPSSQLDIKLISAINTSTTQSSDPDTMNLKYTVNENDSLSQIMEDILLIINEAVPAFHYQLDK